MNYIKFLALFHTVGIFAQSTIDEAQLKVFLPDENSQTYNWIYTQNFFFGNFGLKQLMSAVPVNPQPARSITISATPSSGKTVPVMELHYDKAGNLKRMNVLESFFGTPMTVEYKYRDGLIEQETIYQKKAGETVEKINLFYYAEGKMIVQNHRGMLDVYNLNGKVLSKRSYIAGKLVLNDKIEDNCRLTNYRGKPISKICFSSFNLDLPLSIEEFSMNEDKNGKVELMKDQTLEIKQKSEVEYSVLNNGKEQYILKLDENKRVKSFHFLGIKSEKVAPVNFNFNYMNP
ncbi:MAG: hypothetical protein PHO74_05260 [Weeksellaceae bacterium]|nr:hypothetical protein [Weeksellaceae bacterium]